MISTYLFEAYIGVLSYPVPDGEPVPEGAATPGAPVPTAAGDPGVGGTAVASWTGDEAAGAGEPEAAAGGETAVASWTGLEAAGEPAGAPAAGEPAGEPATGGELAPAAGATVTVETMVTGAGQVGQVGHAEDPAGAGTTGAALVATSTGEEAGLDAATGTPTALVAT